MRNRETPGRRGFLKSAIAGSGAVALGAVGFGLVRTCAPAADIAEPEHIEIDLARLAIGERRAIAAFRRPLLLRRLTAAEIETAERGDSLDFADPLARNPALPTNAPATHRNRSILGRPDVVLFDRTCPRGYCVVMGDRTTDATGDHGGAFCPCCASHFDLAGRIRKGIAGYNLAIPPAVLTKDRTLKIYKKLPGPSGDIVDQLLYG